MANKGWWLLTAIAVAVGFAILATTPPRPDKAPIDPQGPSASEAFVHVERIASEPHVTGSAANATVRAYLVDQLEGMGLDVKTVEGKLDEQAQSKLDYWQGSVSTEPATFTNVIGVLPGRDPSLPAVALIAHYDSVWGSPGAADDATGVAAILETVRAIAARGQTERDIVVVLTDAEELGLQGARAFYAADPLADRVGAIVNLEARGGGGIASMFQTSPDNAAAARVYAGAVPRPATSSLSAYIYSVLPNDTDLTPALERGGYTAYNIAFIGRSGFYHSPLATPENLDRGSLRQMLDHTHALALALANADTLPKADGDAVFFDLFGMFVVVFAPWIGWLMLLIAAAGLATGFIRRHQESGSLLSGVARMIGFLVFGGLLLLGLNILSGAGEGAGYYDRLAAIPKLTAMAALGLSAMAALVLGRSQLGASTRIGATLVLLALGVGAQAYAPTAAYVIVIPVMLASLGEGIRGCFGRQAHMAVAAIFVALVTGYMLYLGFFMMQGVGPFMPYVVALPAALGILGWMPLWPGLPSKRTIAPILLVGAIGMSLWVRFDPVAETVATYSPLKPG
ncbi:M20/M25/M40 family metallo-hydrolase [Pseudoblastomonas halimionae]|uniref:Vacuolar membrane protease n=1 Tax=Alteriqipengyuania halimionae TaxID=1926630 RepID=A0A6I4U1U0_9SPHN|nr:M20/M25/M40 family metallo-hydrolase [Alteriqipengyuania halimionae]MXP09264.1 M20/M25/M40 family metallo-hydrolase [Alteriqipengyuania halimionae]